MDVKFIFDSALLELFSSANILQIADVALRDVFLLFFAMFLAIISPKFSLLKRVKCPPLLFSQQKQLNLVLSSSRLTVH